MFTLHMTIKLKANSAAYFTSIIKNEIIPLLRKQNGFRRQRESDGTTRTQYARRQMVLTKDSEQGRTSKQFPGFHG